MKILNYKKLKNELYEVVFDNKETLKIYEDVIIKYNLLYKDIDNMLYQKIIEENEYYYNKYKVIKLIEKKLRSEKEINEFLYNKIDLEKQRKIIDELKKLNLINDNLFAKAYVNDKYNINKYGKNKIINNLYEYGITENIINDAVSFITDEEELNRIESIVLKYINTNNNSSLIKLKSKIYNYLIDRGYDQNLIYEKINDIKISDKSLINNYNKLYKKYNGKYNEEKIKQLIIQNLINKGYSYNEIKKIGKI